MNNPTTTSPTPHQELLDQQGKTIPAAPIAPIAVQTPPSQTALTKRAAALTIDQALALAKQGVKLPGLPIDDNDWGAMPPEERAEAMVLYAAECEMSMTDITPEFPKIKTPSGGIAGWVLPDGTTEPKIEGVVVYHFRARGWWKKEEITGAPPDCASSDGKVPDSGKGPTGSITCTACPYNQFGSGKEGRGKACKERLNLFIKREGPIPWLMSLPPTGIRPFGRYVTSLVNDKERRSLTSVTTVFKLEKKQGQSATYAVVLPERGRSLSWTELKAAVAIRERFIDEMRRRGIDEAEFKSAEAVEEDTAPPRGDEEVPF